MGIKISRRNFLIRNLASSVGLSLGMSNSAKGATPENPEDLCINREDCHCYTKNGVCKGFTCGLYESKDKKSPVDLKEIYKRSRKGSF